MGLTHSHGERVASRSISNATRQATILALAAVRHVDGGASIDRRRHFRPLWRLPDEADASGLGAKRRTLLTQTGRRKAERALVVQGWGERSMHMHVCAAGALHARDCSRSPAHQSLTTDRSNES